MNNQLQKPEEDSLYSNKPHENETQELKVPDWIEIAPDWLPSWTRSKWGKYVYKWTTSLIFLIISPETTYYHNALEKDGIDVNKITCYGFESLIILLFITAGILWLWEKGVSIFT